MVDFWIVAPCGLAGPLKISPTFSGWRKPVRWSLQCIAGTEWIYWENNKRTQDKHCNCILAPGLPINWFKRKYCDSLISIIVNIIIIIIIGSTALRGPWPFSEASASWSIRLLLLQISWQESFPGRGCQPHAQPPAILEGRCFLSGLSPLAD
jgi:hypothetical protein